MDSKGISSSAPAPPPPPSPPPRSLPMSDPKKSLIPPPSPRSNGKLLVPFPLHKAKSWSPANYPREEAWRRNRKNHLRRSRSTSKTDLTDSDMDELKACFELGFTFDSSSKLDPKLSKTFPALEFYHDVLNKKFAKNLTRSSSLPSLSLKNQGIATRSPSLSLKNKSIATKSQKAIVEPGDDPETVKMKLRHWAQVVALDIYSPK